MPDTIKISELDEALAIADAAEFPYTQENGGELTTFKAPLTQIAAKVVEDMSYAGINLPVGAGVKSVENTLNYLLGAVGGDPNGNISDSYDPTAAYVKGNLCIYENVLYICDAPTTGTFDPSKWAATTIDSVIGSLSTLTTTDKSSLVGAVNEVVGRATYSTSETVVGKWTDGRLVYQRVFDGLNITTTADTWIDTGVARGEIKKIIDGVTLDAEQSFVCAFGFSAGNILINMPIARSALNSIVVRYVKNT